MMAYPNIVRRRVLEATLIFLGVFPVLETGGAEETVKIRSLSGLASWYSETDPGVRKYTANGEVFEDSKKTCASWDFDFGVRLRVTNVDNGKSVTCVVNDRGPAKRLRERRIDLSRAAFRQIGDLKEGLVPVRIVPLAG